MNKHTVKYYRYVECRPGTYQVCFKAQGYANIAFNAYDNQWYMCSRDFEQEYPIEGIYLAELLEQVPQSVWQQMGRDALHRIKETAPTVPLAVRLSNEISLVESHIREAQETLDYYSGVAKKLATINSFVIIAGLQAETDITEVTKEILETLREGYYGDVIEWFLDEYADDWED